MEAARRQIIKNHTTQMIKFRDQLYSFPRRRNAETERYDTAFNSWTTFKLPLPNNTFSLALVNGQIHAKGLSGGVSTTSPAGGTDPARSQ